MPQFWKGELCCASPSSGSSAHPRHRAPSSASTHNILSPCATDRHCPEPQGQERSCQHSLERVPDRHDQVQLSPGFTRVIFSSAVQGPLFKHLSTRTRQALTAHSTSNQAPSPVLFVLLLQGFNLSPVFCFVVFLSTLYIPPFLQIFLPGFLAHSLDILLTEK